MNCPAVIFIPNYYAERTEGRGFAKRTIVFYRCPQCGAEHRSRKNWRGPAPRGGFVCNAEQKAAR